MTLAAEQYLASFGLGNQQALMLETHASTLGVGKARPLRLSRLLQEADLSIIRSNQGSMTVRPRGVVSGFLVIQEFCSTYVPFKGRHEQVRLRVCDDMRKGTVFMAYKQQQTIVLEDVIVWKGGLVWTSKTFPERWSLLNKFFTNHVTLDAAFQRLKPVTFVQPTAAPAFDAKSVLEWIPHAPGQRRLLFVPNGEAEPAPLQSVVVERLRAVLSPPTVVSQPVTNTVSNPTTVTAVARPQAPVTKSVGTTILAKRDPSGPDVFQLWRGSEALGMALIRTMAISKALRLAKGEEIPVEAVLNNKFHKWEIINVPNSA
jgi:hypothetical protein